MVELNVSDPRRRAQVEREQRVRGHARRRTPLRTAASIAQERAAAARTLLDVFASTAERVPAAGAIDAPDAQLTYAQLSGQASALADRLRAIGIGPGDRVGIRVPSGTAALYSAILGVLQSGAAYVPVDADDPDARAQGIWESAGACAVVGSGLELELLGAPIGAARTVSPDDDAWIIFTSGSSGKPKGVAVSHHSAAAFITAEQQLWTVDQGDRVLAGLSVGFDASCEEIWLAWANGATLVPAPRETVRAAGELGGWLAERGITVISTVPTLAAMWDERDLAGVRLLILGGEACPDALAWRLAGEREVWNTYGPTEATVVSTAKRLLPGEPVTIGHPLKDWLVAVIDEHERPVAPGRTGELVIGGVGLGRYLDPELDAERYAPLVALGWERAYRTGDIVRETSGGLHFVGRRDHQVKLGGRRLELGEVDGLLTSIPGVRAGATAVQKTNAGNSLLVAYYVGDVDEATVRAGLAEQLPSGIVPLVVELPELPMSGAGKIDRRALPWPPPGDAAPAGTPDQLSGTAAWLAERWADQLGPLPIDGTSDFFALGGSSLAAAKLISVLRERFPAIAVADVYEHRTLGELAARLDRLSSAGEREHVQRSSRTFGFTALQMLAVFGLLVASSPEWLIGILAFDKLAGLSLGGSVGWGWLIGAWVLFGSVPGRAVLLVAARRLLLGSGIEPGRYPRHSSLMVRIWFLERLTRIYRSEALAGTPFAARLARLNGHDVGDGARLGTLPPATGLAKIGAGATVEGHVDIHGWTIEGDELVVGTIEIEAGARVGAHSYLAPGAVVGEGAEVEPCSHVDGVVPPGERWAGSPARRVGDAGTGWPVNRPMLPRRARLWKGMFFGGVALNTLLPLIAAIPSYALLQLLDSGPSAGAIADTLMIEAPIFAIGFLVTYALLIGTLVRLVGRLVRPGFHSDQGREGWALWYSESLMAAGRGTLFALYMSSFTRAFLRLCGIPVGRGAEISTIEGANRHTTLGEGTFAADASVLVSARGRGGWLQIRPIEIGDGTFLGNGAIVPGDAKLGRDCTIGVVTVAPPRTADGTSWFGLPAIEFPRKPEETDPSRTTAPPLRLRLARALMDVIRITLPATISVVFAGAIFAVIEAVGRRAGVVAMALAIPPLLAGAAALAGAFTIACKWAIIGRYRTSRHAFWSFFVWRDEILNSMQDQLAGTWLLDLILATPLMSVYLRAMGTKVGRDVWCETLTIVEFDVVELGEGCVVNRGATIQTHVYHDRLLQIGPSRIGAGATLAPESTVLPDTRIGDHVQLGGLSTVMRGEDLPAGTSWVGAPVRAA